MAKATDRPKTANLRLMYIGASGTGKTGSLISLLRDGYQIRILDMDNGLDSLIALVEKEDPKLLDQIDYLSFRDKFRTDALRGLVVSGTPKAYTSFLSALNKWDDGSSPAEWGPKHILVVDSLTAVGRAAFLWAQGMDPTCREPRQWYATAQNSIKMMLEMLTSESFATNVIVVSHVTFSEVDGVTKGHATSIGKALGPEIPKYFNNLVLAESKGTGESIRRTITTVPTASIDLKTTKPFAVGKSLPLDTGLATLFKTLQPANTGE